MKRSAFTLIEIIFAVLISALLALGSFKAFEQLYIRSAKAKAFSTLSLQSQIVLDQISQLLYNRIPNSVIGYDGLTCTPIDALSNGMNVLEWIATDDAQLLDGMYDGFVDMNASARPNLRALHVRGGFNTTHRNLVFAGAFDAGGEELKACSGAYGWHGNDSNLSHTITAGVDQITFSALVPNEIYEKYYIANGAYAVTRGEDVKDIGNCGLSESDFADFDNTLFLFYNYYPYEGETYCGDGGVGNVAILAEHVSGFRATYINDAIRISIDMNQSIKGSLSPVHVSKQKAVL